jgi:hypothetical protein
MFTAERNTGDNAQILQPVLIAAKARAGFTSLLFSDCFFFGK